MTRFEEKQYLAPWVIWLSFGVLIFVIALIYFDYRGTGREFTLMLWTAPFFLLMAWLLKVVKMTTWVEETGIRIKTLYIINRRISFSEIETAEARTYKPIMEYGGWGYRLGPKGKAYNMRGNRGVQLHLKNGGRVLIGSQRADELATVIQAGLKG